MKTGNAAKPQKGLLAKGILSAVMLMTLVACGEKKESAPGQAVASVDGQEITIHQLNNELAKTGGSEMTKQLLDGLVARQLMLNAAKKDKLDTDPAVVADIERARELVLVQAYLRSKLTAPARPSAQEIEDFYKKNPDLFAQRKQFEFSQLIIAAVNLTPELNELMGQNKTLEDIAAWLDVHHVQYARGQVIKTSADLPPPMLASLKTMERGRLFIVKEGASAILTSLQDTRNMSLSLPLATQQIGQILMSQKQAQMTEQVLARLKADAKIDYTEQAKSFKDLSAQMPAMAAGGKDNEKSGERNGEAIKSDSVARGVAGFK